MLYIDCNWFSELYVKYSVLLRKGLALPYLPHSGIKAWLSSLSCLRAWLSFIAHLFLKLIEMATNSSAVQPQIPVLSERNYDTWFVKMRTILCAHDLWEFVTIGYPKPPDQAAELALTNAERVLLKENQKKDNKALSLIQQGLSESIFPKISSVESSKKAWDTLETCYQGEAKVKNVKL